MKDHEKSGWEDDPTPPVCRDPGHEAPNMLYVPPGKQYRHVCPTCGYTVILRSQQHTLGELRC